ncbi:serine/threonine-protein kinase pim-3-like [Neosynchiropus ocellatus]
MGCFVSRSRRNYRLSEVSIWDTDVENEPEPKVYKQYLHSTEATEWERFQGKYCQLDLLAIGGNASVYAGYRKGDKFPVAIKHIPREFKEVAPNRGTIPVEVAVMKELAMGDAEKAAFISLLDYYELKKELILVLERPVPAVDLYEYVKVRGDGMKEKKAQQIFKQLVMAAITLHSKNIFHRDIKMENILIESRTDVPRVRLIDFGLSCFTKDNMSSNFFCGTSIHVPPELKDCDSYRTVPITVWQVGVVLYEMLHSDTLFKTSKFLRNELKIRENLSKGCQEVIRLCLARDPQERPSLDELLLHPWLK